MKQSADGDPLDLRQPTSRFEFKGPMGSGAVATVFRAVDPRSGQEVAIKLVDVAAARLEDIQRLAREVMILRELDHPCIVRLMDTGVTRDGKPYLVLELVNGITLRQRMQQGSLPMEDVVDIIGQICSALEEAHLHDVVHQDIKPENVLLEAPDYLSVKVVDFGMARMLRRCCLKITRGNMIYGTPQYMSPERAQGLPASGATDVYAVAILAYEMLTGRRPFDGKNPMEVLVSQIQQDPQLDGLTPAVEQVLRQALHKDPTQRPSPTQLAHRLGTE